MTATTAELDRRRANIRCLELLRDSYQAYAAGDTAESHRLAGEADTAAPEASVMLKGAMLAGLVPSPEHDPHGYDEYLAAQRDALARLEQEAS